MAKPSDDKIMRLLEKILAQLEAMQTLVSPELARQIDITSRLALKIDRMVPDRPTTKGN